MEPTLELRHLAKAYDGVTAVSDVSFAVPPGSIYGLLGPNGAGKSTTIRMLLDILVPDSGEIHFFGRPRQKADLRRLGYLPEERGLYRKMEVLDQLVFLAELRGLKRREVLPEAERWLERVDLGAWGKRKVEELSKGMQQKVQLIGTVLHRPEVLVLDEPFSGLDPLNQELFRDLLLDYRREGRTVLLSTHGMELAERLCDRICLISKGRVVVEGELAEVKQRAGGRSFGLRLAAGANLAELEGLDAVASFVETSRADPFAREGIAGELRLAPGVAVGAALRAIAARFDVLEFSPREASLESIFLEAVRNA